MRARVNQNLALASEFTDKSPAYSTQVGPKLLTAVCLATSCLLDPCHAHHAHHAHHVMDLELWPVASGFS